MVYTKVLNQTNRDLLITVGSRGVYSLLTTVSSKNNHYINYSPGDSYREYFLKLANSTNEFVITSDDLPRIAELEVVTGENGEEIKKWTPEEIKKKKPGVGSFFRRMLEMIFPQRSEKNPAEIPSPNPTAENPSKNPTAESSVG